MLQIRRLSSEEMENRRYYGLKNDPNRRLVVVGAPASGATTVYVHLLYALAVMRVGVLGFDAAGSRNSRRQWQTIRPPVDAIEWPECAELWRFQATMLADESEASRSNLAAYYQVIDLSLGWRDRADLIAIAHIIVITISDRCTGDELGRTAAKLRAMRKRGQRVVVVYSCISAERRWLPTRDEIAELFDRENVQLLIVLHWARMADALANGYCVWNHPAARFSATHKRAMAAMIDVISCLIDELGSSRAPRSYADEVVSRLLCPTKSAGVPEVNESDMPEISRERMFARQRDIVAVMRQYVSDADYPHCFLGTPNRRQIRDPADRRSSKPAITVRLDTWAREVLQALVTLKRWSESDLLRHGIDLVHAAISRENDVRDMVPIPPARGMELAKPTSFSLDDVSLEKLAVIETCCPPASRARSRAVRWIVRHLARHFRLRNLPPDSARDTDTATNST